MDSEHCQELLTVSNEGILCRYSTVYPLTDWVAMTTLSDELKRRADAAGSVRALSMQTEVSYTGLKNLIDNPDATPELETLVKFSRAFNLPLWRIVEMAGFDLGLGNGPATQAQRLTSLIEAMPQYRPVIDHLVGISPDDLEGLLVYLETLERRRGRP